MITAAEIKLMENKNKLCQLIIEQVNEYLNFDVSKHNYITIEGYKLRYEIEDGKVYIHHLDVTEFEIDLADPNLIMRLAKASKDIMEEIAGFEYYELVERYEKAREDFEFVKNEIDQKMAKAKKPLG